MTTLLLRYFSLLSLFLLLTCLGFGAVANNDDKNSQQFRIITLSPHLTEIVFALGAGNKLVGVSDYSDFPEKASKLPSVASYQGIVLEDILRLQPTHILAWQGGNKPQDIQRLIQLGFNVYLSSPNSVEEVADDLFNIATFLNISEAGNKARDSFVARLNRLKTRYHRIKKINAVYYMNSLPLIGIGSSSWSNSQLAVCGISNIFADNLLAYPPLSKEHVIRENPDVLIVTSNQPIDQLNAFWSPHSAVLSAPLVSVDPDKVSRFTPRVLTAVEKLCEDIDILFPNPP